MTGSGSAFGVRPMHKSYKMHDAQLASIAQTIKQMYHVRRFDSVANPGRSETGSVPRPQNNDTGMRRATPRNTVRTMAETGTPSKGFVHPESAPESAPVKQARPSIKCSRCGDNFPEQDFLYTKKSGLCISCWEVKMKVAKCR